MEVCDAFAYGAWCSKRSDYCILGLHCQTGNIMATIDITQKIGPASGEEVAVIAIPPAWSQASSATIWWGGHGRRIALVGGAVEGVLMLSTCWRRRWWIMGDGWIGHTVLRLSLAARINRRHQPFTLILGKLRVQHGYQTGIQRELKDAQSSNSNSNLNLFTFTFHYINPTNAQQMHFSPVNKMVCPLECTALPSMKTSIKHFSLNSELI